MTIVINRKHSRICVGGFLCSYLGCSPLECHCCSAILMEMFLPGANMRALVVLLPLSTLFISREFCGAKSLNGGTVLADLPPRGWNSYDSFSWVIDEAAFLQNAEILAKRLQPHGYEYVVVDYLWYRKNVVGSSSWAYGFDNIDEWGRVFPDPDRWPSSRGGKGFKEVAQKVHNMGLKFGIHVMRGISKQAVNSNTLILDVSKGGAYEENGRLWRARDIGMTDMPCTWMRDGFMSVNTDVGAGRAFLRSLYQQYAEWGVDFVKLDCVFGDDLDPKEIVTVSKLLEELERPMLLSLSPGTSVTTSMAEGISSYVNMYRITGDDWDKWEDVASHFNVSRDFAAAKKIGAQGLRGKSWPDLDMLPLGWLTDAGVQQGPHRECRLTLDEQKTQMTLWSMAKSPLMFGGDLRHIDETTFNLITNPTLLEINYHSINNMEFTHVLTIEDSRSRNSGFTQRLMDLDRVEMHENKVLLTSCSDKKAKGWSVARGDKEPDQVCWQSGMKSSDNLSSCLYKGNSPLTSLKYQGKFQLLASKSMDACLDASARRKRSAAELKRTSISACERNAYQMWMLHDNGTLFNSFSGLCAAIGPEKVDNSAGGVRSWVASGRRGEIYLSFFNLNSVQTKISARLEDVAKVLDNNFVSEGSCDCMEVWTGKHIGIVKETLSMVVEKHGCALFVLKCKKIKY